MILVVKPGLLTTVQDAGRWGFQHQGIPVAGPMDPWSHNRANAMVGNDANAATLEVTLAGPLLRFEVPAIVALSGASCAARVSGRVVEPHRALDLAAGDELDVGWCTQGARAYLAVRGGIDVPVVFGSRATHLPSGIGGFRGRALGAGDRLVIGHLDRPSDDWTPPVVSPPPLGGGVARVLPGPDEDDARRWLDALTSGRYEISPDSNRMGYRLRGPVIDMPPADLLSAPTPMGTIQVPAAGAPIVLMADRQTTGGYARVATVITADLGIVGQLRPGDWVAFERCTHADALAALRARTREADR
jgi:antagonist of KipI